jgi:hypothetical protein
MALYLDGKLVATKVTGGGTGVTSFTDHGVVLGSGSGALSVTSAGTSGHVLTSGGSGADPDWAEPTTGDITNVIAGAGMTGGATSGEATLNVIGGTGITANDNDIATSIAQGHVTSLGTLSAVTVSGTATLQGTVNLGNAVSDLVEVAGYVDFVGKTTPADPATEESRMYIDTVDANNNALYVKIKKNGAIAEVEITSPWVVLDGKRRATRDVVVDLDRGVLITETFSDGTWEAKLPFVKVSD